VSAFAQRRSRAAAAAADAGLEALLVGPGPDLLYLTGYDPPPLERLTLLVLRPDADATLVVPRLEAPGAEAAAGIDGVTLVPWRDAEDAYALVAASLRPGRVAVTDRVWASHLLAFQAAAPTTAFVAAGVVLPLLRAVKDADEIERLRRAGAGADAAFDDIVGLAFAGRREVDVAADLDRLLREHGHQRVDFTIVGSGPNGASPHHDPTDREIEPRDAVVLDFGGMAGGYCSDITRTVFVGEPTLEQRSVYDVVRAAQQAAFDAISPGVAAQDVDRAARAVIADAGYGDAFIHRTGHGIGVEVHEPPYIVEGNETPLAAGMAFSDEPGIYLDGRFGVRIEDQVVVTETGAERLNEAPRDLLVVS
jgi:D-alanyl-D-alanine dipeptidase